MRAKMEVIYLFCGENTVKIPYFRKNNEVFGKLKQLNGVWDADYGGFVFNQEINIEKFKNLFNIVCVISNKTPQYQIFGIFERPQDNSSSLISTLKQDLNWDKQKEFHKQDINFKNEKDNFSEDDEELPEYFSEELLYKLEAELRAKKYSIKTQKAYIYYFKRLCNTLKKKPEEICSDDVTEFLSIMEKNRNYSASSINLALSAIKFFFKYILKNKSISEQKRPNNNQKLPMILSAKEVIQILTMEKNPKHHLLLMLVYSSGLRVSEVVALKKEHIDLSRQVIYIKLGKGRKDRYTMLSEKASQVIQKYYKQYKIENWVFQGQIAGRHLTIRSAQRIFEKAVRNAGITKDISIHGLRHTFATHLLETGTDIRYIQELLGHSNIRTTERYTQVAKRSILNIKSPLDTII